MAKKSISARNERRIAMSSRHQAHRDKLRSIYRDVNVSISERRNARAALAKKKRNTSQHRVVNRCFLTGRGRAVYRMFGLCGLAITNMQNLGMLPGLRKASW